MSAYGYIIIYVILGCLFTLAVWRRNTLRGQILSILFFPLLFLYLLFQVLVLYMGDTYLSLLRDARNETRDRTISLLLLGYIISIQKTLGVNVVKTQEKDEDNN